MNHIIGKNMVCSCLGGILIIIHFDHNMNHNDFSLQFMRPANSLLGANIKSHCFQTLDLIQET